MATRTMFWGVICCGMALIGGALLVAGTAGAQSGGLPQCQAKLKTCTADLGACEADLTACQAEPTAVFPGDGVDGPPLRYTDNGDGTVTDNNTLLMWEVKDNNGGVHDVNNTYSWTGDGSNGSAANGTLFTVFLNALNNTCDGAGVTDCTATGDAVCGVGVCGLAGHRDWRIPNAKELQSIVDYGPTFPGPTIASSFPGTTAVGRYWSSTSRFGAGSSDAWSVNFDSGSVFSVLIVNKPFPLPGRAVRGGR